MKEHKKIDHLINRLTDDLSDMPVMRHPLLCCMPWVVIATLYVFLSVYFLGLRDDFGLKISDPAFLFELVLTACLSISSAFAAVWLRYPDIRGQTWIIAIPFSLFGIFVVLLALRMFVEFSGLPHIHLSHKCYKDAVLFGLIPAIVIIALTLRGKTTHPVLLAFMNALSVGGVGYIGLRLTCHSDEIGHLCIYHLFPYIIFAFIASILARRIYRW